MFSPETVSEPMLAALVSPTLMAPTVTSPVMAGRPMASCWVDLPPISVVTTSMVSGLVSSMVSAGRLMF